MKKEEKISILEESGIRSTRPREEVLGIFRQNTAALSQPDIEKALAQSVDRVTIYRTLSLFLEKGVLHKVLDDAGAMKYALCREICSDHHHAHNHVHFKCTTCGQTECMDKVEIPDLKLPAGYKIQETNLLMSGTCAACLSM